MTHSSRLSFFASRCFQARVRRRSIVGLVSRVMSVLIVATTFCGMLSNVAPVIAQDPGVVENIEAPWLDSETGGVQSIPLAELEDADTSTRQQGWQAAAPSASSNPNFGNVPSVPSFAGLFQSILNIMLWIVAIVAVIGLVALGIYILMRSSKQQKREKLNFAADGDLDVSRVEELPFEVARPQGDLLGAAQAARDAGRLKEAIVLLFAYLLLKLEKHSWISLAKGKTNRRYLREIAVARQSELDTLMEGVVVVFEDAFFGGLEPERTEFDRVWSGLERFHRIVEGVTR